MKWLIYLLMLFLGINTYGQNLSNPTLPVRCKSNPIINIGNSNTLETQDGFIINDAYKIFKGPVYVLEHLEKKSKRNITDRFTNIKVIRFNGELVISSSQANQKNEPILIRSRCGKNQTITYIDGLPVQNKTPIKSTYKISRPVFLGVSAKHENSNSKK
ncbi:MAG: hypothetical protein ACPGLV_07260 [Bacteroidia bacterium]